MASTILVATAAASFIASLGVNTHLDFDSYGYQNLTATEQAITYLGIQNLRDSGQLSSDVQTWSQVAKATGAKFDNYMPEGSTSVVQNTLAVAPLLAGAGILNFLEGGNEEDDAYAVASGDSLSWTAQFQQQVYQTAQSLGLQVINMSFGAGWTSVNNWQGDYGTVGDLSAYCNYGNAHTYPGVGHTTDVTIARLNGLAKLAAASRPVITSELGWSTSAGFTQNEVAQYVVQGAFDGLKEGDAKTYFYALFDDSAGSYGLMNTTATPRPAGTALHNLTTLLADATTSFSLGQASYSLAATDGGESTLLLQKSDGSYWFAVWDETDAAHSVIFTLASSASEIQVFDPVTSTVAIQTLNNTASATLSLSGDLLLVKVVNTSSNDLAINVPGTQSVATGSTTAIAGVSISDPWAAAQPGTMALTVSTGGGAPLTINGQAVSGTFVGSLVQLNADLATLIYKAGAVGTGKISVNVWNQAGVEVTQQVSINITASTGPTTSTGPLSSKDLTITVPGTQTATLGAPLTITGVSISDPWATSEPGTMALNLSTSSGGALTINGQAVSGTIVGSLMQLNADVATLTYKAGAIGTDKISVNVWNQAGVQVTQQVSINITAAIGSLSSNDLAINVPLTQTATLSIPLTITGVSISDPWAAARPGTMALNLSTSSGGTLTINGQAVSRTIAGSLVQLNADLATLTYKAGAIGRDSISVNVWNQAGVQTTKQIPVDDAAP